MGETSIHCYLVISVVQSMSSMLPVKGDSMKKWTGVAAVFLAMSCLGASAGWAAGTEMMQFGPVQGAMAASVATPLDSNTILTNPAGLVEVPNRADTSFMLAWRQGHRDSSAAPIGNPTAGEQRNQTPFAAIPALSSTLGIMDNRLVVGLGFWSVGGNGARFARSAINSALTGDVANTYTDFRIYKIAPAVAYKILDNLSIGAAVHMGISTFASDAISATTLTVTSGRSRTDTAFGVGGALGVLYEPIPEITLGVQYLSKVKYSSMSLYRDITSGNSIDSPQQVRVGIAGHPFDNWVLTTEFQWVNWSSLNVLGNSPANGGLGWQDQYLMRFGTQYSLWKDRIHLRAGYEWQSELFGNDVVWVNAGAAPIATNFFTGGVGVDITSHVALNAFGWYSLKNSKTQVGGDPVAAVGAGTRIDYQSYGVGFGVAFNWDKKDKNKNTNDNES